MKKESFAEDYHGEPPFPPSAQLCDDLEFIAKELGLRNKNFRRPRLPGRPQIELYNTARVVEYCSEELCTPEFDSLARGRLSIRLCNEKQHSLSEYAVLSRSIVVTENPKLHCVWDDDKMFIKPIPPYLASHAFWHFLSVPQAAGSSHRDLVAAANGFLRSYSTLITHPSDFHIARKHHLIPEDWDFDALVLFLQHFADLPDSAVTPRYTLGEMQLQTLNRASCFRHRKLYLRIHRNRYNAYFTRFYAPTLFVFATFSVVLSAMQVAIAVRQSEAPIDAHNNLPEAGFGGGLGAGWAHMGYAFRWFSIWSISFVASMGSFLFFNFLVLALLDSWADWKDRPVATQRRSIVA
ncbi:uncharacterized protein PV09_06652 [Verruconis gallopava]|uniref:Uncharacterized protein n=1 Tax=Verruconis gallopava TaxID=253628 RepID=A0A0D1XHS3_9PEZI|nr:uncharacterized protein PV09_06652 [Verruconis gallopava]KIW01796.1 hypothetical protein PV09_06652 [Verruconis gallopava]